jgi:signal transduction histidine kinase/HAMP domain-containing protein
MLRTRLFLNLLPFVVILVAVGLYAIILFSRLAQSVDVGVAENYRSVVATERMLLALGELDREAWAASVSGGAPAKSVAAQRQRFEESLATQLRNAALPGEFRLNSQLAASYASFRQALDNLGALRELPAKHRAYEQMLTPNLLRMRVILDNILELNQKAILATSQRVQAITQQVTRLMMIGLAIALTISAYACFQLSRSILAPIQLLTKAAVELGEMNSVGPVPVLSLDELGRLALAFNKMAAQLQEFRLSTSAEIVRLHRTMETTLASFPDPIFVLNKAGAIELKNPAAAELAASLKLNGQLLPELQARARTALERGENFLPHNFDEALFYRINGAGKFFLPRVLAMRDKSEAQFGVAVVLSDVTRFRLLDAAKTDLVATVSHELKTPLTSVRMALHILLERTLGELTPKQDELLVATRHDAERLLRILNDLLDLARLEEGNAELQWEAVPPTELLKDVMAEASEAASSKSLLWHCDFEANLPLVRVDRQRIKYVFANLVSNALKHSPAGGQIRLRVARAEPNHVHFSVTDQGAGIPEQFHTRIFDRFFRVPGQVKTGAGLGLSIAREITIAHGGRIWVKSTPGQGSSFFVRLAAAKPVAG